MYQSIPVRRARLESRDSKSQLRALTGKRSSPHHPLTLPPPLPPRPGAQVLSIALSVAECHEKLLLVSLPGINMLEDDGDEFTG